MLISLISHISSLPSLELITAEIFIDTVGVLNKV